MPTSLDTLDALILELRGAVEMKDLLALSHINDRVRPCVDDVIAGMHAGNISEDTVRERLTTLQTLTSQASDGAEEVRASAGAGLKEVRRNHSAASKYADISGRGAR